MSEVTVMLSWIPHAKGGRKAPPVPPPDKPDYWYSTVVRFDIDPQWRQGTWSLVVWPEKVWGDGRFWIARAKFLVEAAPHAMLRPGARFELLEGNRVAAHGMVTDTLTAQSLSADALEQVLLV